MEGRHGISKWVSQLGAKLSLSVLLSVPFQSQSQCTNAFAKNFQFLTAIPHFQDNSAKTCRHLDSRDFLYPAL
jgi:hypothetical protein